MPSNPLLELTLKQIQEDPQFLPFRKILLGHRPLLEFVYHEKCRFPSSRSKSRIIWEKDPQTGQLEQKGGYIAHTDMPCDEYSPDKFQVFQIKGIWLPLDSCHLYSVLEDLIKCPLIKSDVDDQLFILFLIHPRSEAQYQTLLDNNPACEQHSYSALSLSSFRTLLVALPNKEGAFDPVMVKVGYDETIGGVNRLLSMRECQLSVANTALLAEKKRKRQDVGEDALPITFVQDPLAIVPYGFEHVGGMLYRKIPDHLNPRLSAENPQHLTLIPLLSLYGVNNRDLFETLIDHNGGSLTEFLYRLFTPLANIFVELFLLHNISIQAHGQNLLLQLNGNQITGFYYRDMGGVNQIANDEELTCLKGNLKHYNDYSYVRKHKEDSRKALEDHWVVGGLFPLTKQAVKSEHCFKDPVFLNWYSRMQSQGLLKNWTTGNSDNDEHAVDLHSRAEYCRYGYVEAVFADCLICNVETLRIFEALEIQDMRDHLGCRERLPDGTLVPPCSNILFFEAFVGHLFTKRMTMKEQPVVSARCLEKACEPEVPSSATDEGCATRWSRPGQS